MICEQVVDSGDDRSPGLASAGITHFHSLYYCSGDLYIVQLGSEKVLPDDVLPHSSKTSPTK